EHGAAAERSDRRRARAPQAELGRHEAGQLVNQHTPTPPAGMRVAGDTNVGKVRETNEDSLILEPVRGLYAVLDGMGGANAGDIASQTARDAIRDFVTQKRLTMPPKQLLEGAIL